MGSPSQIESVSKARTSVTEFETNLNLLPKVPRKAAAESVKSGVTSWNVLHSSTAVTSGKDLY